MDSIQPQKQFEQFVSAFHPMAKETLGLIWEIGEEMVCQRQEIITWAGDIESHLYFVLEGEQWNCNKKMDSKLSDIFSCLVL